MQIMPYCFENRTFKFEVQWCACKLRTWRARQILHVHIIFRQFFSSDILKTFKVAVNLNVLRQW